MQGAGAGGGNRAGPSCWATGGPRRGLAGWASSMARLIPGRTKSLPVVLAGCRSTIKVSDWPQQNLLECFNAAKEAAVRHLKHPCVCVCVCLFKVRGSLTPTGLDPNVMTVHQSEQAGITERCSQHLRRASTAHFHALSSAAVEQVDARGPEC